MEVIGMGGERAVLDAIRAYSILRADGVSRQIEHSKIIAIRRNDVGAIIDLDVPNGMKSDLIGDGEYALHVADVKNYEGKIGFFAMMGGGIIRYIDIFSYSDEPVPVDFELLSVQALNS